MCAVGSHPEAIALTMVVSENGLQWSPKTAPPKTAPIIMGIRVANSSGGIWAEVAATRVAGNASGILGMFIAVVGVYVWFNVYDPIDGGSTEAAAW